MLTANQAEDLMGRVFLYQNICAYARACSHISVNTLTLNKAIGTKAGVEGTTFLRGDLRFYSPLYVCSSLIFS